MNATVLLFPTGGLVAWQWQSTRRVLAGEGRFR